MSKREPLQIFEMNKGDVVFKGEDGNYHNCGKVENFKTELYHNSEGKVQIEGLVAKLSLDLRKIGALFGTERVDRLKDAKSIHDWNYLKGFCIIAKLSDIKNTVLRRIHKIYESSPPYVEVPWLCIEGVDFHIYYPYVGELSTIELTNVRFNANDIKFQAPDMYNIHV